MQIILGKISRKKLGFEQKTKRTEEWYFHKTSYVTTDLNHVWNSWFNANNIEKKFPERIWGQIKTKENWGDFVKTKSCIHTNITESLF